MKTCLSIFVAISVLWLSGWGVAPAHAQSDSRVLTDAISRLKNNPRYDGRVLGTHVRRGSQGYVYEVRILRRDDEVIIVYIDPETGGVVGDSERSRRSPNLLRGFSD